MLIACDFDGTLAPIVASPDAARPLPGVVEALTALAARRDCRVAIVSGRALSDLQRHLPLAHCWFIGGHGNESAYGPPDPPPAASPAPPPELRATPPAPSHGALLRAAVAAAARELQRQMPAWPGARLEAKPYSLALHFRLAPACGPAIHAAAEAVAARGGFRLLAGRQLVELLPDGALTKGQAVHRLRRQLHCDLAFYFGDDTTDEDVFRFPDPDIVGVKVEHRDEATWTGEGASGAFTEQSGRALPPSEFRPQPGPRGSQGAGALGGEPPEGVQRRAAVPQLAAPTAAAYRLASPSDVLAALRTVQALRELHQKKVSPPLEVSP
ncbi:MAG: trehalose-phosphatase [Terriglobales bacterium]